jgi:O-antigen ligase
LLAAAAVASVLALVQMLQSGAALGNLMGPMSASGRISGPFGDPNYFGAYLGAMAALAVALALEAGSMRVKGSLSALTALLSITLLLTQSRGALLSAIAGLIVIAFVHSRRAGLIAIAGLSLAVVLTYPVFSDWRFEGDEIRASASLASAAGRTEAWIAGVDTFLSSPLFGIGLGRFGEGSPGGMLAHNWYVQILAELGVVGFVIWALFIGATVAALRGRPRPARATGYAVLAVWLVASLTLSSPQEFRTTGAVLITIAAACVALWPARDREAEMSTIAPVPRSGLPRIGAGPYTSGAPRRSPPG